jgi:hypothetical protein
MAGCALMKATNSLQACQKNGAVSIHTCRRNCSVLPQSCRPEQVIRDRCVGLDRSRRSSIKLVLAKELRKLTDERPKLRRGRRVPKVKPL